MAAAAFASSSSSMQLQSTSAAAGGGGDGENEPQAPTAASRGQNAVLAAVIDATGAQPMYLPAGADSWAAIGPPAFPETAATASANTTSSSVRALISRGGAQQSTPKHASHGTPGVAASASETHSQLLREPLDQRYAAYDEALRACFASAGLGGASSMTTLSRAHGTASPLADAPPPTPAQCASGSAIVFEDTPSTHREQRVDALRIAMAEDLGRCVAAAIAIVDERIRSL